jgi:hypothetical protein
LPYDAGVAKAYSKSLADVVDPEERQNILSERYAADKKMKDVDWMLVDRIYANHVPIVCRHASVMFARAIEHIKKTRGINLQNVTEKYLSGLSPDRGLGMDGLVSHAWQGVIQVREEASRYPSSRTDAVMD